MDLRKVSEDFGVSPQLGIADLPALAAAGFRSLVCNRPDGEAPDRPTFHEIEAEAKKHGLVVRFLPVVARKVRDEDADDFGRT